MLIYFVCLFIVVFSAYIARNLEAHRKISGVFIFLAFAAMILLPGLRDMSVGTDTASYVLFFDSERRLALADILTWDFILTKEIGYFLLTVIAGIISDQYWALLTTVAVAAVFCHLVSIYKFSLNPAVSLFVFITLGFYTFFFNGARQGLACAVYSLAMGALINDKFWKYAFWVFIACLFHRSAIIALPLFFLFRMGFSPRPLLILATIAIVGILTFDSLLNMGLYISAKYAIYQKLQATGAQMLTVFFASLCVFFMVFRSFVSTDDKAQYDIFLNMFMFGSIIFIIVLFSEGYIELTRIAVYFQIAAIFLWPIIFRNIRWSIPKMFLGAGFVVGHLVYFYVFLNKMANLTPYEFNPQVLRWWM